MSSTSGISVVMPNHFHGILMIDVGGRGGSRTAPTTDSIKRKPLGQLVGAFKTVSAKQINILRNSPGLPVWQRGYYDRIIRDEREMDRIQRYIESNPSRWAKDGENLLDKNIGQPSSLPGTEKPI
jgi:REP element-mobilizing transposase RayT